MKIYGDNDFEGLGVLTCAICNGKLRDHSIGPCPELNGERFTAPRPSRRDRKGGEHPDTVRRRRYARNTQ